MEAINITKGKILKYVLLPQVGSRINTLLFSGFSNLAYFIALVYRAVNILPSEHIYLDSASIGKYTIRNVFSEAASHIQFTIQNMDKIIIFFALIAGIIILFLQFFILIASVFVNPASAQTIPVPLSEFFTTPNPDTDLALRMLNSVFGIPEIFGAGLPARQVQHEALHGLFQIYSFGLLVIAAIILAYFIFAVLAETAQTGTPFGKRYNHVWAPIRLVVGIGLLVPITLGLNAGQWITLQAATLGSGFATTGWITFNSAMTSDYIERDEMVASPEVPNLKDLAAFMMLAHACTHAFEEIDGRIDPGSIEMYIIAPDGQGATVSAVASDYYSAVALVGAGDILIRFGWRNQEENTKELGGVEPLCGDIVLQNTEDVVALLAANTGLAGPAGQGGRVLSPASRMNAGYFIEIQRMWNEDNAQYRVLANTGRFIMDNEISSQNLPDPVDVKQMIVNRAQDDIEWHITAAAEAARQGIQTNTDADVFGWGGASLWYNQIADANGQLTTAIMNKPQIKSYPDPMEFTCEQNSAGNENNTDIECYSPNLSNGLKIDYNAPRYGEIAKGLSQVFAYWYRDSDDKTGNAFIDVINAVFGLQGLFDMCSNVDIHPLAQLSSLGKGLVEAAVRNLGLSVGSGAAGILAGYFGPMLNAASQFFGTVASIGILIGFILFYVVPFLPFLYFMFAVGGWIKGIFEAMVGVPLWALAHLRIDGDGLPGEAAINGYFLIFEIFIRPILIVFGFIASIIIFAAMVKVLNSTFALVVSNLGGYNDMNAQGGNACANLTSNVRDVGTIEWLRGPIDEFFFSVLYAIVVYMTAMSCFKLIDQIPNNIMRWMGQGVQTFNDQSGDPAQGLLSKIAIGGSMMSQNLQIAGSLKQTASSTAAGVGDVLNAGK